MAEDGLRYMRRIGRWRTSRPRRLPALSLNGSPRQSAHCRRGDRWHERTAIPLRTASACTESLPVSLASVNRSPDAGSSTGVSGGVRLARSDADLVFGTGAGCRGRSD
jgi:hypothetical protein